MLPDYAELHALSNFSFQRGASHPQELVERAHALGYSALALTDECSVAGVVRAHVAARQLGLPLIVGSEFLWGELRIVALARDLQGWGDLCEFISAARACAAKGGYRVDAQSPWALLRGCELLLAPRREVFTDASDLIAISAGLESARGLFCYKCWLAVELHLALDDGLWLGTLTQAGARLGLPLVAAGDVHLHARAAKPLQDVITAVGLGRSLADCGFALQPHAEKRHTFTQLLFFLLCQPVQPAALSGGKREVFLNGHAGRAAAHRVLKKPPYVFGSDVLFLVSYVFSVEDYFTAVTQKLARNRVKQRGFACTVRAYYGDEFALIKR